MGNDVVNTVFRIFYPQGFGSVQSGAPPLSIDLDQTYLEMAPTLVRVSDTEYRFTIANGVVSRYQNMVVRLGTEPYLLPIPTEDRPAPKPVLDADAKTAQVVKGKHGPVECQGSGLDAVTEVNITQTSTRPARRSPTKSRSSSLSSPMVRGCWCTSPREQPTRTARSRWSAQPRPTKNSPCHCS
jgi:hypothetical protein